MMEYLSGFFKHDQGMIYDTCQTEVCQSVFKKIYVLLRCVTDSGRCWTRRTADFSFFLTHNLLIFFHNLLAGPQTLVFVFTVFFPPAEIPLPPTEEVHVFLLFCNVRVLLFHV